MQGSSSITSFPATSFSSFLGRLRSTTALQLLFTSPPPPLPTDKSIAMLSPHNIKLSPGHVPSGVAVSGWYEVCEMSGVTGAPPGTPRHCPRRAFPRQIFTHTHRDHLPSCPLRRKEVWNNFSGCRFFLLPKKCKISFGSNYKPFPLPYLLCFSQIHETEGKVFSKYETLSQSPRQPAGWHWP